MSIQCRYCGLLYLHYGGISVFVCILCLLWSITEIVSFTRWSIQFKVLMLNVVICILLLHFSNFYFSLSFVADFFNTGSRVPTSAGCIIFFTCTKGNAVWWCGLCMSHSYLSISVFYSHLNRWASVVPWSNYLILAIVLWD